MATNPFLQSPFQELIDRQEPQQMQGSDPIVNVEQPQIEAAPVAEVQQPQSFAPKQAKQAKIKTASLAPPTELRPLFAATAEHFGVPENVLMAIAQQESSYNTDAVNKETGAAGIAQYMGATAKSLGINARDPNEAIPATALQIRERMDKGLSLEDAIKEHFAGPNRKLWGEKTAAYGREVLDKAEAIGRELYDGSDAAIPASQSEKQNSFAADRMARAEYEANFKALNPKASPDALATVMTQYDEQAKARTKARGNAVQDRFANLQSPEAMFDARLNAKLQAKNQGVAQAAPSRQQPSDVNSVARERPGIIDQAQGDFGRGIDNLKALGYGVGGLVADQLGNDEAATSMLDEYVNIQNEIAKTNPATIGTYKNVKSLGDAGRYAIEAVAENLPMLIPSLVSGGVGAQIAKKGAERVVAGMIEAQVAKGVAREIAEKQAAQFVTKRILQGSIAGAVPASVGMESGSIMGDIYQETGDKRSGLALAGGIPAGLLDSIGPVMALRRIAGPVVDEVAGGIVKRLGVEGAKQFFAEAGTEGLQTVIEQAAAAQAANRDLMTPELLDNVIDAALKGGIGGAVIGGASQGVNEVRGALAQPNMGAVPNPQPQERIEPTMDNPAQAGAEAAPSGPLSSALQGAANVQEAEDGFTAQVMGDDGQMYTLDSRTGVMAPAEPAARAGPLEAAIADAAEQHANDPVPAPIQPQAEPAAPDYTQMALPDLQALLKDIAGQAKASPEARKQLTPERKQIEQAVNAKIKEVKAASKPAEESLTLGPFDDMGKANRMMLRFAESTGQPHEVIEADGKFRIQSMESTNEIDPAASNGTDGLGRSGGTADPVRAPDSGRSEPSRTVPVAEPDGAARGRGNDAANDRASADVATDTQPTLTEDTRPKENPYKGRQFSAPAKGEAFIDKEGIDRNQFEVVQTGDARWQILPRLPKSEAKEKATAPINLVRMSNAEDFDWNRAKPNGTYASIADDPDSFTSPFADDYKDGKRHDKKYTPENPLEVGPLTVKHARFGRFGSGDASAGVKALSASIPQEEFDRVLSMTKEEVQGEIARRFPEVDSSTAKDSYEALEIWGAQEAKAKGHDIIIARDSEVPAFSEAVLLGGTNDKPAAKETQSNVPEREEVSEKAPPARREESAEQNDAAGRETTGAGEVAAPAAPAVDKPKRKPFPREITNAKQDEIVRKAQEAYDKRKAAREKPEPVEEADSARFSVSDETDARELDPLIQSLADSGAIIVHADASTLPDGAASTAQGIQAMTASDGRIHVVADALGDNARGVVLHEAFHAGGKSLVGSKVWDGLMQRLGSLHRQAEKSSGAAREFFDKARARVATAKAKGAVANGMDAEEFGAYAIEEYEAAPQTVRKWVDDLLGAVKAWALRRFGRQLGQVSPAQLSALAKAALMDVRASRTEAAFSLSDKRTIEVDGVRRPIRDSEGNPIAGGDFMAQMEFWRNYNGELDSEGRPILGAPDAPRFSIAGDPPPTRELTPPEQGLLRRVQAQIQDSQNRIKQVQDRIKKAFGVDSLGSADHYLAETNRPGRIAARKEDARDRLLEPMIRRLADAGYELKQLDELLHAQHAKERNEAVAKINPEFADGGSGLMTKKAEEIIERYKNEGALLRLADEARNIARETLELKKTYGLMTDEQFDTLATAYENYVPLKGDGEYGPKVKRAMGHGERDEHILENIARDYEQAVIVGEKNVARQSLVQMVLQFADDALWTARVPPRGRYVAGTVFNVKHKGTNEVEASYTSQSQVAAFLEAKGAESAQYEVNTSGGEQVVEFTKPLQDNEVMVYIKGSPVRVQIYDETLARQLRPLRSEQMNAVLEAMRAHNRWLSMVFTGYNPSFIIKNATRDAITGTINMTGNNGAITAAKAWARYPMAWATMLQWAATKKVPDTAMGQYLTEYRSQGGKVGASYMSDLEEQGKSLQRMFDDAKGVTGYAAEGRVLKSSAVAARKAISGLAHAVEVLNQAFENALRLALFAQLRAEGKKPGVAAAAAKAVTVNFDRKGAMTPQLGAFYLFINPAIQGTANLTNTLVNGEHKYQAWALTGMMAAAGFAAAVHGMDDDKDRWLGEKWDTRTKNLRLRVGETTINIPLSQEYAPFYAVGVAMGEVARGESGMKSTVNAMSSFLDAYYPMQGAGKPDSDNPALDLLLAHIPTVAKVPAQIATNRSSFGGKVIPEAETTKNRPDNLKMNRGTKGSVYDAAAQALASGKPYENDLSKVSPETLKLLWTTYTGGLGRFVADTVGAGNLARQADTELDASDVPIVKDFIKPDNVNPIRSRFYDMSAEARKTIDEFAAAKKSLDRDAMREIAKRPEAKMHLGLAKMIKSVNEVQSLYADQAVSINADKSLTTAEKRDRLKQLEAEQEAIYRKAIEAFSR